MLKAVIFFFVFVVSATSAFRDVVHNDKRLQHEMLTSKQKVQGLDFCPECITAAGNLLELVLNAILEGGVFKTCGDLCQAVAQKSGSSFLGFLCTTGCDILGMQEFVNLVDQADLDPIYYCEIIKICPVNDNGDAKIQSFTVSPNHGPVGTKFLIEYTFSTRNGTGTGSVGMSIKTIDKIPLAASFLLEAKAPGNYGARVKLDAYTDPDCDPEHEQCEQWLPGKYIVDMIICNGECGSHHPHSQIYDSAQTYFMIDPSK